MDLKSRIVKYIQGHEPITMDDIIDVATQKGFTQSDILTALDLVHKDKRITQTANASSVVIYKTATAKEPPTLTHLSWVTQHYPWPDADWTEAFPEIDLGAMFLRTKEERDAYKAEASGRPLYMNKKNYGR